MAESFIPSILRTTCFLFFLFTSSTAFNQSTEVVKHQDILDFPGRSAETLFESAKTWANDLYQSSGAYVQKVDSTNRRIKCKGSFTSKLFLLSIRIRHSLYLEFKDGKCRYTFTDYIYQPSSGGNSIIEKAAITLNKGRLLKNTEKKVEERAEDLKNYLISDG